MGFRLLALCLICLTLSCSSSPEDVKGPDNSGAESKQTLVDSKSESKNNKPKAGSSEELPKSYPGELKESPVQWLAKEEIEQGWLSLFDGQTLFGWRATSDANWTVKDGAIQADEGNPGFLMTPFQLKNYIFRCEYRLEKEGNSGVFLRTPMNPTDPSKDCYEFNLCDSHEEYPTGSLVGRKKVEIPTASDEQWRTVWIKVEDNQIHAQLNGRDVLEYKEEDGSELQFGHIGLQMNGGKIEFRNIAILPLGENKIFNNHDLSGWKEVPGSKSKFTVKDDILNIDNGSGFLESEQEWKDFVLNIQARTNGDNLNGGVFYRAIKGTEKSPSNGYELQIHNGFANNDRSQPNDYKTGFGTGSIFRRTKVRWVASDDKEWFSMTLLAQGPSFYSWVNGLQVVDFTDTRKKNDNPRKGLKVEKGHLSLQGHDETTNIDFRKIAIIPLDQ